MLKVTGGFMPKTSEKLSLRQAAEGLASIADAHLSKLPPAEQEKRMGKLRKTAARIQNRLETEAQPRIPVTLPSGRVRR